jgi:hypothetical protein
VDKPEELYNDWERVRPKGFRIMVWSMAGILLMAIVLVPLISILERAFGPSAKASEGQQLAQTACLVLPPAPSDYPPSRSSTYTYGDTLDAYKSAEQMARRAKAADARWGTLDQAYRTLIEAWTARIAVTGPYLTQPAPDSSSTDASLKAVDIKWSHAERAAVTTINSICDNSVGFIHVN